MLIVNENYNEKPLKIQILIRLNRLLLKNGYLGIATKSSIRNVSVRTLTFVPNLILFLVHSFVTLYPTQIINILLMQNKMCNIINEYLVTL